MFKSPITKTGDIRYFEFIKLFVLVSFFYAFISNISNSSSFVYQTSPLWLSVVIYSLIVISALVASCVELFNIMNIIKGFVVNVITISSTNVTIRMSLVTKYIKTGINHLSCPNHQKLCVVRC